MNKKRTLQALFLLALIIGTILIIRQQHSTPYQKNTGMIFGTVYNVSYQYADDLKDEIEAELKKVDAEFSMFNQQSTVAKINRGENPELSDMFREVFIKSKSVYQATAGAFDPTVAPLVNAWGFGFKSGDMPTRHDVDSLLRLVGFDKVEIVHDTKYEIRGTRADGRSLDFAAIAKGYGSDVIARFLRRKGIENFMVEIGGEVVTQGINRERLPWKIGVVKPTDDSLNTQGELQTVLNITNRAMATSGNYRNFYYKGGRKYAHTIDPKTGYPVQHSLLSATVLADDCATADAFATAFMVMGMEEAKKVLERHPDLLVYFIYSDSKGNLQTWHSPALSIDS